MTGRLLPFNLFVLDCCLLALPLLLLGGSAAVPPGVLFLLSAIVAGIVAMGLLQKRSYHWLIAVGICLLVMSSVLIADGSAFLYAVFVLLLFQRLHARFSVQQDEYDGNFLLLFLLLFPLSLFALIIWGEESHLAAFYAIAFFALVFFSGSRLLYWYTAAAPTVSRTSFLNASGLLILLPAGGALAFYLFIDEARVALGTVLGGILAFVLQPFGGLMEKLLLFLESVPLEPRESGGEMESPEPVETATSEMAVYAPPFSYEWLAIPFLAAALIVLILWLRKRQYANMEAASVEVPADINYGSIAPELREQQEKEKVIDYSAIDLPFIREAFREFEREAAGNGYGRQEAETVREWFSRMDWHVPVTFFGIYDNVRYGSRNISESDAQAFLREVEKIKKFFSNEV